MASWNRPIITNDGIKLINSVLNNETITITNIVVSSTRYEENKIASLSSLSNIKITTPPSAVIVENEKLKITAKIQNTNINEEFYMETIGILCKKNNQGDEILLAVIKSINSDIIPSHSITDITIDFVMFLMLNRDVNFTLNYNTNSLLTLQDLNDNVAVKINNKADKRDTVTSMRISDNKLYYKTLENKEFSVTLPEVVPYATDTTAGKISNNNVKEISRAITNEIIGTYGVGTNIINNNNINNYLKNGIYVVNEGTNRIDGATTTIFNVQYDTKWGVQLALVETDDPKLYIRAKRNNSWTTFKEMVYKSDVATDTKKGIISKNEIKELFPTVALIDIWKGVCNG